MTDQLDRLKTALTDRYTIERELGRGGMAVVYLAHDRKLNRQVALKVLRPELAASLGSERFLREIEIAAKLAHPNILALHDCGRIGGLADGRLGDGEEPPTAQPPDRLTAEFLYYTMPYVEGESLRDRLNREKQLPIDDALQITKEVADALGHAHALGIVHRDIKPENILFQGGHAVVSDFGIARAVSEAGTATLTETGLAVGTPAYMSPEQALGSKDVDARSDIYALACVLYEMLTGETPHLGNTPQAIVAKKVSEPAPRVSVVRDKVPPSVEAALDRALSRTAANRFATAAEFLQALSAEAPTPPHSGQRAARRVGAMVGAVALVVTATLTALLGTDILGGPGDLDPNRVLVFPLVVSGTFEGSQSVGEDVATMIGNVLDGAGPLRWIDGWSYLTPSLRENIRGLGDDEARSIARAQLCAYYLTGRVSGAGDSAVISLVLHSVHAERDPVRGQAAAPLGAPWKGVSAVNSLLPELISGDTPGVVRDWADRSPAAVAAYLQGEAAFRRIRLDEALDHYRAALSADSSFAMAAIRGAQTASWAHRNAEASALIEIALRLPLQARYAAFAHGYRAYLDGRADSAISALRTALALDDRMAVAWLQLGETWTHLLPEAGAPDDSALAAFLKVVDIDSTASNALFHTLEILLRRGEVDRSAPLLAHLVAADPQGAYAKELEIMFDCVTRGPDHVRWDDLAAERPFELFAAAYQLSGAGAQLPCANAGFAALLQNDTSQDVNAESRRLFALLGLQNNLLAQGREADALARVDAFVARWGSGKSFYLLAAPYYDGYAARAREVAREDAASGGPAYAGQRFDTRLWELGLLEATIGSTDIAERVADEMADRARRGESANGTLLAASIEAHVALATGDTALAFRLFDALVPAVAQGDLLRYDEALPLGAERLEYVRLLVARGEYRRAIDVANVFDSAWPVVHVLYLAPSLELRAHAAAALGDRGLERRFRTRLQNLRQDIAAAR